MKMKADKAAHGSSRSSNQSGLMLLSSISKTNSVVTTNLHRMIRHHMQNKEYNARRDELDFLQVKNGMMLSYLIDLVLLLRYRLDARNLSSIDDNEDDDDDDDDDAYKSKSNARHPQPQRPQQQCLHRLTEMKTALEKIRPLEKRMRYQIDKLLALSTLGAGAFAAVGREHEEGEKEGKRKLPDGGLEDVRMEGRAEINEDALLENDPLSFKPNLQGMIKMFEGDGHEDERNSNSDNKKNSNDGGGDNEDEDSSKTGIAFEKEDNDPTKNSGIYQPPRHQSVPFESCITEAHLARQARLLEKQHERRSRSELTALLRSQYTDAPDEEDARGGTSLGKQSANSRRLAAQDDEIQEFEEGQMIRLTMGRKEKRERKKVRREEMSNLGAIAGGLAGVVAGVGEAFGRGSSRVGDEENGEGVEFKRKSMRKRKVEILEQDRAKGGQRSRMKGRSIKSIGDSSGIGGGRKSRKRK